MISPRIVMYVAMAGVGWMVVRRLMNRSKAPKAPPLIEDQVVPGIDRRGDDAYCRVTLTANEAKAGTAVTVPSIDGPQRVEVPAGIKDGARLRLAGFGFRREDGKRGDQYVLIALG